MPEDKKAATIHAMQAEFRNESLRKRNMHQRGWLMMIPKTNQVKGVVVKPEELEDSDKLTRKPGIGGTFVISEDDGEMILCPSGWESYSW